MTDALPLNLFLATPSDLQDERHVVGACVQEHNRRVAGRQAKYELLDWDRVRGTVRRPQEAINELIEESHFMVVMFKGSWGSESGGPWGYTSGTEEELFTGLLELAQREQPMRDIWVAFLDHDQPDERITALRKQISKQHAAMYESIVDIADLKQRLSDRLSTWALSAGEKKVARHVTLLPRSGRDVLKAAKLRIEGEKLVELGHPGPGRKALEESSALGGPIEQMAFARFLVRQGDLVQAYEVTQQGINHFLDGSLPLQSPLAAEAFSAQAEVLLKQGLRKDAIHRLEHALSLVDADDVGGHKVWCRIVDNLGLAYQREGNLVLARKKFEAALIARRAATTSADIPQSLINLARLEVGAGDLDKARLHGDEALEELHGIPPTSVHANAHVLAAQLRMRQGRPEDGIEHAETALSINRQIANTHGEAISLLVLAQCCHSSGHVDDAKRFAEDCRRVNESMGDQLGLDKAQWILDKLA